MKMMFIIFTKAPHSFFSPYAPINQFRYHRLNVVFVYWTIIFVKNPFKVGPGQPEALGRDKYILFRTNWAIY